MIKNIQISIIIPTRNRPSSCSKCCESIYPQIEVNNNCEVIVIDDGSVYKNQILNKEICNKFGFTYHFQKNQGVAVARNKGIAVSSGCWVIFLDDDVVVSECWFKSIVSIMCGLPDSVIGIEGMVEGSGDGVWDREVENLNGGAFLTCHLAIRRSVLVDLGGFDEYFSNFGYCEDHELAARLLDKGKIIFNPKVKATHLPREVNLVKYVINSPQRIKKSLYSEYFFYKKHPEKYYLFRHSNTFLGTYRSILFKNVYRIIRRRSFFRLIRNPIQFVCMILAALIEQIWAWLLIMEFIKMSKRMAIDKQRAV